MIEHSVVIKSVCFDLSDNKQLAGLVSGENSQPPLLCLHGWLDNAASFIPVMNKISNRHVLAIDWPGHGHSSHRSQDAHYHFIDYVYDLLVLFEHNQWPALDIVAHSMGGMIATAFSAAFPEKVKSLTLIDSIGFISGEDQESTKQLRQGMLSRLKKSTKNKNSHKNIHSGVTARVQVSDLKDEHARLIVERGMIGDETGFVWRADSRLRKTSPYRLTKKQAEQFIRDVNVPVQLIYGDTGLDMVQFGLKHYAPLFIDFKAIKLSGGHHIHMEQPQKTAQCIVDFIK
jgi:pimeloyl-ACP methyl ester carboxylesterase